MPLNKVQWSQFSCSQITHIYIGINTLLRSSTLMWRNQPNQAVSSENVIDSRQTLITKDYTYIGDMVKGLKSGRGSIIYRDNSVYSGNFIEDQFSGRGTFIYENGAVLNGTFSEGELVHGTVTFKDQTNQISGNLWRHMFGHNIVQNSKQYIQEEQTVDMKKCLTNIESQVQQMTNKFQKVNDTILQTQEELLKQIQVHETSQQVIQQKITSLEENNQKLNQYLSFKKFKNVHAVDSVSPIQDLTSTQDLENIAKQLTKTEPIVKKEEKTFNDIKLKPKAEGQKTEMTEETKQELIKNKPFLNEISKPKAVKLQENTELEDIFGAKGKNEEKQEPQTTKTIFGATALPADKQKEQTSEFPKYTFGAPQNKTDKSNDQKPMGFGAKNEQKAEVAVNTKPTSFKFGNVGLTNTDDQKKDAKILSKEEQLLTTFKNTIVDNKTIANNKIEPKNIINQDDQVIPTMNNKGLKDKTEEKSNQETEPKIQPENKTTKALEAETIIQDAIANSVVNQKSDKQEKPKSETVTKDKPQGMLFSDEKEKDLEKDAKPVYENLFEVEDINENKEEKDTKSETKTQQFRFNFGSKKNEVINTEEMPLPAFNKNKAHFEPKTDPVKNKTELTEDIEIKPKINMKPSLFKNKVPDDFQPKKENFLPIKEAEKSEPALPFIEDSVNEMW
ncbi:MORN_motif [Hexamita inflata]|uniref:MORN motif n=1 Tax=Hexamita inflata TaxID=28002 RepID=A0AA86RLV1_9EUKA|nr:MORN motif [Hexamita inflata]